MLFDRMTKMTKRIDVLNRVILITGASAGIGAATARACARAGMRVLLNGRRANRLQQVVDQIRQLGGTAEAFVGDVTEPGMSQRLLDAAQERFGGFYAVLANAGYGFFRDAHATPMAELRHIFEVNFFAAVELVQLAAQRLVAAKQPGHLLMTSSALAKITLPFSSAYSATKAAQNHICRAMNLELKSNGIHVTSVHPITTTTEFFQVAEQIPGHHRFSEPPRSMIQSAERVADAIVKCLRKPRPEVWTSGLVRRFMGWATIYPSWVDFIGRRQMRNG